MNIDCQIAIECVAMTGGQHDVTWDSSIACKTGIYQLQIVIHSNIVKGLSLQPVKFATIYYATIQKNYVV